METCCTEKRSNKMKECLLCFTKNISLILPVKKTPKRRGFDTNRNAESLQKSSLSCGMLFQLTMTTQCTDVYIDKMIMKISVGIISTCNEINLAINVRIERYLLLDQFIVHKGKI